MTTVALVFHSGYGHTAELAKHIADGARSAGVVVDIYPIDAGAANYDAILDAVSGADAVIFGAPTYMGDVSAAFRSFAETSSKVFATGAWKDKLAAGFTNSHSFAGDKLNALQSLAVFAAQHGMNWINAGEPPPAVTAAERDGSTVNRSGHFLGLGGQSDNAAPELSQSEGERETARRFGRRVALAAIRWRAGAATTQPVLAAA